MGGGSIIDHGCGVPCGSVVSTLGTGCVWWGAGVAEMATEVYPQSPQAPSSISQVKSSQVKFLQSRKPHQHFLRGSMSALSFPKLPGDVKD